MNLTLLDFLTQSEVTTSEEIKIRGWLGIDERTPRPSPKPFNSKRLKLKLKKYINVHPPLSLNQISIKIGYDKSVLNQSFPEITGKLKSNYNEHQKLICETRRSELEREIKSAVFLLEAEGMFVSTKRVANFLNKPSYEGRRDVAQIVFDSRKIGKRAK